MVESVQSGGSIASSVQLESAVREVARWREVLGADASPAFFELADGVVESMRPVREPVVFYSVGHGFRGYLPESAPYATAGAWAAFVELRSELDSLAESLREAGSSHEGDDESSCSGPSRCYRCEYLQADSILTDLECNVTGDDNGAALRWFDEYGWSFDVGPVCYWVETVDVASVDLDDLELPAGAGVDEIVDALNEAAW